jgi:hypothetical protein
MLKSLALIFVSFFICTVAQAGYIIPPDNCDIITPNGFPGTTAEDVIPGTTGANTPHWDNPVYASDNDNFSDGAKYNVDPSDSCHCRSYCIDHQQQNDCRCSLESGNCGCDNCENGQ